MPESNSNLEFAHRLQEHGDHLSPQDTRARWLGFAEAFVLAAVAVATAWSSYQASRWDAISAKDYALQGRNNVLSQAKAARAGRERLYDGVTFNGWVAVKVAGRDDLAAFYERRFRPEYAVAFAAWMRLDPIHNRAAPPRSLLHAPIQER